MPYRLRRHPLAIAAHFRHSLVLAYTFPRERLEPLLPPGLVLDTHGAHGLAAVAVVQTERLRPRGLPRALGLDFVLCGYRIFVRVAGRESLRGLYILRSETNRRAIALLGNLLTHYRYRTVPIALRERGDALEVDAPGLEVCVRLGLPPALPDGSRFEDLGQARRFAGPLPYTFDYERETGRIVAVRGVRSGWEPEPVTVERARVDEFADGVLANAFHVAGVEYAWERGRLL
jgi:hypothetical protein